MNHDHVFPQEYLVKITTSRVINRTQASIEHPASIIVYCDLQMASPAALADYSSRRGSLIADDRSMRREFAHANAQSDKEIKADKIIRKIRALEAETIWREDHRDVKHPFPGMEFLTGKSIIMKTRIFEILSKMPKGALLHSHLDATVNAEYLLDLALKHPFMHIRLQQPLTAETLSSNIPVFRALPAAYFTNHTSLMSAEVGSWISLQNARNSFPSDFGGVKGFDKWVIGSLTINPTEAYDTHNTVEKIWHKFSGIFLTSAGLIRVQPIWLEYIKQFFRSSVDDGVSYVEARINFLPKFMVGSDGQENIPHREWLLLFEQALKDVKEEFAQQGRGHEFIGAKIIYSTIRAITPEELDWYTEDCIALKKEFPHLIIGFDLVGPENAMKPLIYYIEPLLRFRKRVEEEGLDIPFIFHAGETLGDGTEADVNLYDAILLGTKRIGHGYSLFKHPKLVDICRRESIAVEVCPISNEILRLTSSMLMHPLPALLNNGVPIALCSDDPAVFGNMGLTFDYYQVFVASEINGLSTLASLARDSIQFSMMDAQEKAQATAVFEQRWAAFVDYVLTCEV